MKKSKTTKKSLAEQLADLEFEIETETKRLQLIIEGNEINDVVGDKLIAFTSIEDILIYFGSELTNKYIFLPYLIKEEKYELCAKIKDFIQILKKQIALGVKDHYRGKVTDEDWKDIKRIEEFMTDLEISVHKSIMEMDIDYSEKKK